MELPVETEPWSQERSLTEQPEPDTIFKVEERLFPAHKLEQIEQFDPMNVEFFTVKISPT
jgi:hypothetical protein